MCAQDQPCTELAMRILLVEDDAMLGDGMVDALRSCHACKSVFFASTRNRATAQVWG